MQLFVAKDVYRCVTTLFLEHTYCTQTHTHSDHLSMPTLSEKDVVFEGAGDPVDDEAPIVAQRGEEPGVGRRPLRCIYTVFMFLIGRHHAVL